MKNILIITHDIPSNSVGATIPFYHMINNIKEDYNLTLVSFTTQKYTKLDITTYSINIPEYKTLQKQLTYTLKNMISFNNLKTRSLLNYYYKPEMDRLIQETIKKENIELIITDLPMAIYTKNNKLPKIVYAFDAVSTYNKDMSQKAETFSGKIYWYLQYKKMQRYEKIYNNYDVCLVVNKRDKKLLEKHIKNTPIKVVPNGVDTTYFTPKKDNIKSKKLVFLGDMKTPPNIDAINYFCKEIYPLILEKQSIELFIVGRNPTDEILKLNDNKYITVTNEVADVRDFLDKNTIFIAPMISGIGIKNKILEAMAMQLPVITTLNGVNGIDAINNKHLVIASNSKEFADYIILLYQDLKLCDIIGSNARLFVEKYYSWSNVSEIIKKQIDLISK
ncbi:MAG: glycosyltransferase [Methanobacteriaceae archaeon]|nr:glycosyltransferase [Methanobacteriaceae archaeon]